ncbi:MAG TPA: aminopeptidase P family protein [Bacteroidetes bacterium]|nr:aminopeptidase P family protein [Bacteroidota bacterium]
MTREQDFAQKLAKIRQLLEKKDLAGVLITQRHNFAWATAGGRDYVGITSETGAAWLWVDQRRVLLVANNIETPRVLDEELSDLGVGLRQFDWWQMPGPAEVASELGGERASTDVALAADFAGLRSALSEYEIDLYRRLGKDCGVAIGDVARSVRPGDTENQVAGRLAERLLSLGIFPVVLLVAADDRVDRYRHPLPTGKAVEKKVMLVVCGMRHGLIASVTRLVHFGALPDDLRRRHQAVTYVDAVAISETRPGKSGADVFAAIQAAYAESGFPDEWRHHHQGGATGYQSREWKASPTSQHLIRASQAFAWNPSIAGTKSEDTVLLTERGIEVLTATPDWPLVKQRVGDFALGRPDILEL